MVRISSAMFIAYAVAVVASPALAKGMPTNGRSLHGFTIQIGSSNDAALHGALPKGQHAKVPNPEANSFSLIGVELAN